MRKSMFFAVLIAVFAFQSANAVDRAKYYRHDNLKKAGTDTTAIIISGTASVYSDTLEALGWPYRSLEWNGTQTNDSVSVACTVFVQAGTTYTSDGRDVNNSTEWSVINITAAGAGLEQIAMPLCRRYYFKFTGLAGNGTNALIGFWWLHAPQGE